ncbi:uncharacterized protein LOC130644385 [Hydractinia symbiolongicarpus]|uniref:uncharacterized protein LOC130644385 n=1 Tax=Hydractinia symbiolongicarpus TaxID=13093 RepID=UPI00254A906D|nr:uncharacterized protein LOC130644385 [Hydractinia symbiolongicarpus]XP_057305956.1 uncharacterized protein LOC130644385 [Hydractinia symbiolongicarpus]XP_057305957.1 uncharacterized protein LOC130644385 [Hydractinia symbiolongicarpus]
MLEANVLLFIAFFNIYDCLDEVSCNSSTRVINVEAGAVQCNQGNRTITCPNLTSALLQKNLNGTCINLLESQTLNQTIPLLNVHNFVLIGNNFNCSCNHENASVGLSFENSSSISITNIIFTGCGGIFPSTSLSPEETNQIPYISTALHFKRTTQISFIGVKILNSFGYGITLYDCGKFLNFFEVKVMHSGKINYFVEKGVKHGGGVYIEQKSHKDTIINLTSIIKFERCNFSLNAEGGDTSNGQGAGITFTFLVGSSNNKIKILNTIFLSNKGLYGAALHITFEKSSCFNSFIIKNCSFTKNHAVYSGGAVRVVSLGESLQFNIIRFIKTSFIKNSAIIGGAFYQFHRALFTSTVLQNPESFFVSCNFSGNMALLGSACYIDSTEVSFCNVSLTHHTTHRRYFQKAFQALGTLYAYRSHIIFCGTNNISNNFYTGVILDYSFLIVNGTLTFVANSGENGGAMAMYQHSRIFLYESTRLVYRENTAKTGGAIFVSGPWLLSPEIASLQEYHCFINNVARPTKLNGAVRFVNNTAKENGNAIFATTISYCPSEKSNDTIHRIKNWPNMNFDDDQVISTDPVRIVVNLNEEMWHNVWPGKEITPTIQLIDETNNYVSGIVDIDIEPEGVISLANDFKRFVVTKEIGKIELTILAIAQIPNFNINIGTQTGTAPPIKINVKLAKCPFGYFFKNSTKRCVCYSYKSTDRVVTGCIHDRIYVLRHIWVSPAGLERPLICPFDFCDRKCSKKDTLFDDMDALYNKSHQCRSGRDQYSILCGRCKGKTSVAFGSSNCLDCSNKQYIAFFILLGITIFVAGFVFIVLWLNFDLFDNYLNSTLYFYQVAHLLKTPTQEYDVVMKAISGIINLNIIQIYNFKGICFFDGFNDMYKMLFNYFYPFVGITILVIVVAIGNFKRDFYFNRVRCFRAVAFLTMLSYGNITRVTFNLLNKADIDSFDNEYTTRLYIYGEARFFNGDHYPVAIFAILVLVIVVIGFPLLLMFSSLLLSTSCCVKFKPIYDSFSYPFKETLVCQLFTSYYFVCRCVMLAVYVMTDTDHKQLLVLAVICIHVLLIFSLVQPYKEERLNYFDMIVLCNLAAIGVLTNGRRKLSVFDPSDKLLYHLIQFLMWPPLVCFLICLVQRKIKCSSLKSKILTLSETFEMEQRKGYEAL